MGTRAFSFDAAGNLTSITPQAGPATLFAYDSSGRTKQVTAPDGTVVKYRYGPDERRALMSVDEDGDGTPESVARYFTDGLVSYEVDGLTGALKRAYVFMPDGYTPVMLITFDADAVAGVFFFHNDHLATPRALTDESGAVVWRARYEPFGGTGNTQDPDLASGDIGIDGNGDTLGPPLAQPIRFPGQWDDGVEGVWYNWNRFYLPRLGIYGTRDPVVHLNQSDFSYSIHNPLTMSDPAGLAWVYIFDGTDDTYPHAAIEADSGEYLSLYPKGSPWGSPADYKEKDSGTDSYKRMAASRCARYYIDDANEERLSSAIQEYKAENDEYSLFGSNCADAVREVLSAAGVEIPHSELIYHGTYSGWEGFFDALENLAGWGVARPKDLKEALEERGYNACGCLE
jgi:RHS repeat-associated protein